MEREEKMKNPMALGLMTGVKVYRYRERSKYFPALPAART